jgi:hypothetical protein
VLQAVSGRGYTGCLDGCFQGYQGKAMQDSGYELPRILIPRTPVNKGKKKRPTEEVGLQTLLGAAEDLTSALHVLEEDIDYWVLERARDMPHTGSDLVRTTPQIVEHRAACYCEHS